MSDHLRDYCAGGANVVLDTNSTLFCNENFRMGWPLLQNSRWNLLKFLTTLLFVVLTCLEFAAFSDAAPPDKYVCAVLGANDLGVIPVLEARLLEQTSVTWVERTEIQRVLGEQELANAFGAADGTRRAALGKLLKADVLVLVRSQKSMDPNGPESIECIVSETRQGLRLRTATIPLVQDLDAVADELEQAIAKGLEKRRQNIETIVAVPPFLSDDLTFENNHLQAAYARLVEQVLLELPGVLVVELTEAQAVARELALDKSGSGLQQRRQALYVMGRYRHDSVDKQTRLRMSLRLVRNEEQLSLKGIRDLPPADAANWLLAKTAELTDQLQTTSTLSEFSAEDEARQIALRAKDFQRVGNWEEAYALYEASILLKDSEDLRREAVVVAGKLALQLWGREEDLMRRKRAMAIYERGLDHLEQHLRTADGFLKTQNQNRLDFASEFETLLYMRITYSRKSPEILEEVKQLRRRRAETYLRIARMRAADGRDDRRDNQAWDVRAVWMLPQDEQLAIVLRIAKEWKDLPDVKDRILRMAHHGYIVPGNTVVLQRFLNELQTVSPDAEVASHILRRGLAANELRLQEEAKKRPPAQVPVDPAINAIVLQPDPQHIAKWESRTQKPISGVLPLGDNGDLFWAGTRYFILDKGAKGLRYAFDRDELAVATAFDGKYVWFGIAEKRRLGGLMAVNLATGEQTRFTADDGLPLVDEGPNFSIIDRMQLAAVAPGHICLAVCIERTWIANVKLHANGKKHVDIFHEAREAGNNSDHSQAGSTKVAFHPSFMFTLRGEGPNDCRIILGRNYTSEDAKNSPLVIDPISRSVAVADYLLRGDTEQDIVTANRNAIYVYRPNYPRRPKLMRVTYPGEKMELFLEDAPDGKLAATQHALEIIGKKWWTLDLEKRSIQERSAGVPWFHRFKFFVEGQDHTGDRAFVAGRDGNPLQAAIVSSNFGPLAVVIIKGRLTFYDFDEHRRTP